MELWQAQVLVDSPLNSLHLDQEEVSFWPIVAKLRACQAIVDMLVDLIVGNKRHFRCLELILQLNKLDSLELDKAVDNVQTLLSLPLPQRSGKTLLHVAAMQGR